MPCGRKRPFMVTVFENSNFQLVPGSNARVDVQTVHNLREDCTQQQSRMVSTFEYRQSGVQGLPPGYGEADLHSTQLQKRHCQGLELDNTLPTFAGECEELGDQEMMVCEEYQPQEQRVEVNLQYSSNTSQIANDQNQTCMFPLNSFPLAGLNKAANNNLKPCAQCLAGQGGHINHIVER